MFHLGILEVLPDAHDKSELSRGIESAIFVGSFPVFLLFQGLSCVEKLKAPATPKKQC